MVLGGLWLCLWTTRPRWLGMAPLALGALGAALTSTPDLLVTGDGRHLAITTPGGAPVILRDRSGDFTRSLMSEAAGYDGDPGLIAEQDNANCGRDTCIAVIDHGTRRWLLLATRSRDRIKWTELVAACREVDIVVSDRWLPKGCQPRWLKLDRRSLEETGGVAIFLGKTPRVETVAERLGNHPWRAVPPVYRPRIKTRIRPSSYSPPSPTPQARFPTGR